MISQSLRLFRKPKIFQCWACLLILMISVLETKAQADTSSTYLHAIRFKNMVNQELMNKYHQKLDTNSAVFINELFLEPLKKGRLAHNTTSNNFFDKVKLVREENYNDVWIIRNSDPDKFLGHILL